MIHQMAKFASVPVLSALSGVAIAQHDFSESAKPIAEDLPMVVGEANPYRLSGHYRTPGYWKPSQTYKIAIHESKSWDFEVLPKPDDLVVSGPEISAYQKSMLGEEVVLPLLAGAMIMALIYAHLTETKNAIDEVLWAAKKGKKGIRFIIDFNDYLKQPQNPLFAERAYEYLETARRFASKGDYQETFVNLNRAAFNGNQMAASSLLDLWRMLASQDKGNDLYASYAFLREGLSDRQIKKVLEFYTELNENIIETRRNFKPYLIKGGKGYGRD